MDIRAYNTKDLPYHFIIFYNLPESEIRKYSLDVPYQIGENAVLTYCYIDRQAGLSYELICKASLEGNGNIRFSKGSKTSMMKIREGALISDAVVLDEDIPQMSPYKYVADRTKDVYGYHIDMVKTLEAKRFSNRRHVCYPDDIMVFLYGMGCKPEQIWVTEISENDYPENIKNLIGTKVVHSIGGDINEWEFASAGRLINQPFNKELGYVNGDIVPIYSTKDKNGEELPIVPAKSMVPNQ